MHTHTHKQNLLKLLKCIRLFGASQVKESSCEEGDMGDATPVFLPRESYGQRRLVAFGPQGYLPDLNLCWVVIWLIDSVEQ